MPAGNELIITLDKDSSEALQKFTEDMVKLNREMTRAVKEIKEYKKAIDSLPWYARLYMFLMKG